MTSTGCSLAASDAWTEVPAPLQASQVRAMFPKVMRPTSLINRFATTDEVANMFVYVVVFVCSEQASSTRGAALRVDGGVVRYVA